MASSCKLELARFSTLLRIQERAKCGKGTELHGGGDTAHTFLMSGTNGVGTPHNIERKHILGGGDTAHTLLGWGHRTTFTEKAKLWVGGPSQRIMPLCGSILQAGTCQILSLGKPS